MGLFGESARIRDGIALLPGLPNPSPMRFRLNHVHDPGRVAASQRAQVEKFGFFLRSWYNTADVNAGTQNPDLRLQQLKMGAITRRNHCRTRVKSEKNRRSIPIPSATPGQPEGATTHGIKVGHILAPQGFCIGVKLAL